MTEVLTAPTPGELAKRCEPINLFERELAKHPAAPHQPVFQRLTKGLYMRTIRLSAGIECTSRIHNVEHQFIVSRGVFDLWSEETGAVRIDASEHPVLGVTKPGARRAFRIIEDTYFSIFVPTTCTDLSKILDEIMEPQEFPKQPEAIQ